jgi:hypothetical protein
MVNIWRDLPSLERSPYELERRLQESYRALSGAVGWGRPILANQYDGLDPNIHAKALDTTQSLFALMETHDSAVRYQGDNNGHAFEGPFGFAGDGEITGDVDITGAVGITGPVTITGTLHGTGAVTFDGPGTLGDAAADAWLFKGTNTFNEDSTFVKNVIIQGNTTLGNAAGDVVTITGTATFAEDVTMSKGLIVDTTTLVVEETNNKVGIGAVTLSTDAMFQAAGFSRIVSNTGAPTAGEGLELLHNTGTHVASIQSFDRGGAAYLGMIVNALSVDLRAQNVSKFKVDEDGVGFFGVTTAIQQFSPGQVTDVITGTADAAYGATEEGMLNDLKDAVNNLVDAVNSHTDALEAYGLEA